MRFLLLRGARARLHPAGRSGAAKGLAQHATWQSCVCDKEQCVTVCRTGTGLVGGAPAPGAQAHRHKVVGGGTKSWPGQPERRQGGDRAPAGAESAALAQQTSKHARKGGSLPTAVRAKNMACCASTGGRVPAAVER